LFIRLTFVYVFTYIAASTETKTFFNQSNFKKMKQSVKRELESHILDLINDGVLTDSNKDDWHFHAFNEDYYIIGYYQAEQWLKEHNISVFEAIGICQEWEDNVLGERTKDYDNAETLVNMLVYVYGEELLSEIDAMGIEELKESVS
jgi:hypothetical protein